MKGQLFMSQITKKRKRRKMKYIQWENENTLEEIDTNKNEVKETEKTVLEENMHLKRIKYDKVKN